MDARVESAKQELARREAAKQELARRESMQSSPDSSIFNMKNAMKIADPIGSLTDYAARNIGAGAVEGNVNLAKTVRDKMIDNPVMASMLTDIAGKRVMGPLSETQPVQKLSNNIGQILSRPYESFGTEEAPFYTPSGALQSLGKYYTGGEIGAARGGISKALELAPEAMQTASFLRKQLPNMLTGATAGAGMELNEAKPTLLGAVEKSLMGMLTPPAISKMVEYTPKGLEKIKDSISKTWDTLTPGNKIDEIQSHLSGETKQINKNVNKQIEYIDQASEKEKSAYEAQQNSKIRDVTHDYDTQINNTQRSLKDRVNEIESHSKNTVADLNEQVKTGTEQINNNLGRGLTNTEQVATSIADDIRALHDPAQENASAFFEHVLSQTDREAEIGRQKGDTGRGLLYEPYNPLISTKPPEGQGVMQAVKKHGFGEVGSNFVHEPTVRNAHNLKQEVGFRAADIRSLGKNKTQEQRIELNQLDHLYHQLDKDMMNYLDNKYPNQNENLSATWKQGNQIYQDQVLPFLYHKKLREINRYTKTQGGRKAYTKNIHEAFEHPGEYDVQMPDGTIQPGPASKLLELLPERTKNLILFNKLGSPVHEDINAIAKSLNRAKTTEGMSQYVSPSLEQQVSSILEKQRTAKELPFQAKENIDLLKANISDRLDELKANKSAHVESLKEDKSNKIKEIDNIRKMHHDELKGNANEQIQNMEEEANKLIKPLEKRQRKIKAGINLAAGATGLYYLGKNIYSVLTGK